MVPPHLVAQIVGHLLGSLFDKGGSSRSGPPLRVGWMVNVGACLTLGLIPVALFGLFATEHAQCQGTDTAPGPIFWSILALLAVVGLGLLIYKVVLTCTDGPEARYEASLKRLGRNRTWRDWD